MADRSAFLAGLGRAVREARIELRISQEELGLRTGVHRNYIGGIERGERNPSVTTIVILADGLEVAPSELIREAEG
jgi:transcriptional regulator with XRE-family HTH domain